VGGWQWQWVAVAVDVAVVGCGGDIVVYVGEKMEGIGPVLRELVGIKWQWQWQKWQWQWQKWQWQWQKWQGGSVAVVGSGGSVAVVGWQCGGVAGEKMEGKGPVLREL
jgi:hypothetical protein